MPLSLRKRMTKPEHISAIGWMLFSAFCFAVMGAFTHALSGRFDWSVIAFSRAFVNLIFIAALALVTSKPLIFFSAPANLWWRSVSGTFSLFGTFYVFSYVPIAEATSVVNTVPLWMVIMLAFISKQHVPRSVWFAVFCGIAGVCFIQQPHFNQTNFAIAIGLAGAFWGLARDRDLAAFMGSSAFLAGLSMATAACVFPVMLRAIHDPALSLTAFNSGGDPAGLTTALRWLVLGLPLALFYLAVVFRLHRGRAEAAPEGEGY